MSDQSYVGSKFKYYLCVVPKLKNAQDANCVLSMS